MCAASDSGEERNAGGGLSARSARVRCCETLRAARDAIAGAPRISQSLSTLVLLFGGQGRERVAHLHGLYRIVRLLYGVDLYPLGCVGQKELIDDLYLIIGGERIDPQVAFASERGPSLHLGEGGKTSAGTREKQEKDEPETKNERARQTREP
jgi:hypothetical protein